MENKKYKYDVAFSFLKEDEKLAQELNDLIKDKAVTFLFLERQDKIVGTDGEETFNRVFGQEARVVVVLYKNGWGNSPWTRIEETAIKNRALVEGYEFTLFIPLDEPPEVPKYLPRTYIWFGIHKYGINIALSIIESKIQSQGGKIKLEVPEDIAKRIKEAEQLDNKRRTILNSENGVEIARLEVKKLYDLLKNKKDIIEKELKGFPIGFEQKDQNCYVNSYGYTLRFYWQLSFRNSLMDSYLSLELQSANRYPKPPTIFSEFRFNFDIIFSEQQVWMLESDRKKYFTSEELVKYSFDILLKHIEKENKTKRLSKYL